jgi:CRP/FNR family transcriptional regulator
MITGFQDYLRSRAQFSEMDLKRISSLAVTKVLNRNDFLFYEGEICRHKAFIAKGMLRTFGISSDGNEHILQFSPENSWALDGQGQRRIGLHRKR